MIYILIIIALFLLYWFFFKREKPIDTSINIIQKDNISKIKQPIEKEIFIDENGKEYWKETKEIQIPRKTFIKGNISGKYRGELIELDEELHNSTIYGFEIYEAEVNCQEFREKILFKSKGVPFPKDKLPEILQVSLFQNDKWYGLNVLEPKLFNFESVRKLHQIEGNEIFGTFSAEITGYILDYKTEFKEEIIYVSEIIEDIKEEKFVDKKLISSNVETGKIERKGDYFRKQYYTTDYVNTTWGSWQYSRLKTNNSYSGGCLSSIFGGIGLLFGLIFLIDILPGLIYIIPVFAIILLISVFENFFKWVFRIFGILLLLAFVFSIVLSFNNRNHTYNPKPLIVDNPRESKPDFKPIIDSSKINKNDSITPAINDTIISRFRSWQDYEGNKYEGFYQIKLSDFNNAHQYKNNLKLYQTDRRSYDEMIYRLKEYDKNKLNGLYKLLDSINTTNKLDKVQFAEVVVSFVQDIPYTLILDDGCNASLYNDEFTRNYLSNPNARCEGNQKFGINTPIEFLTNLKGDCDTRTLLLYTVLSHYDYDVALLCSEQYGHSILGINLPINGTAINYNGQRYVVWETTAPNIRPGILSQELSNLNNWRISIKSK
ncbi:MAG TPA: hypothetical protein VK164_03845 [Flavobacterium sp.]|uniref:hypothetical protein n=1 Tax=Flavobacterium sp. TaxID=239 RepID=UPI002B4AFABA|nr:hypothetical protein [Flavobacterium sp.]HLO73047.1 hypothetical protein [Flavobacterium sp.]